MIHDSSQIILDFVAESKNIISELEESLEDAQSGLSARSHLETYGQKVDRIMGGAKSLAMNIEGGNPTIERIGDYAALCKAVGYKASQIADNAGFYSICVALLMDATEVLAEMVLLLEQKQMLNPKELISQTLIDRLKWVSGKFSADYRGTVAVKKTQRMNQEDIDNLLKKLGLD